MRKLSNKTKSLILLFFVIGAFSWALPLDTVHTTVFLWGLVGMLVAWDLYDIPDE